MQRNEFRTDDGVRVPTVTRAQMAEVDRVAIEETGPNLFQMMENAGRNLATMAIAMVEDQSGLVVVLAGTGGNGGGGIAAARHLANHGFEVLVVVTDSERLGSVPEAQARLFSHTPGRFGDIEGADKPAIVLDAIIGYSLSGSPRGRAAEMISWANDQVCPILSLDLPSGLDADTGDAPGVCVRADATLTLALPKPGLVSESAGDLTLGDLGIPVETIRRAGIELANNPFSGQYLVGLAR